jgi:hypothetical protein
MPSAWCVGSISGLMALAGCCLSTTESSGSSGAGSSSGTSTGPSTGTSTGTSTTGGSSTGGPTGPFFGEIEAETLTPEGALTSAVFTAKFMPTAEWPACRSDLVPETPPGSCCFVPPAPATTGLSAGTLQAVIAIDDGGPQGPRIEFDGDGGFYLAPFEAGLGGLAGVSATGAVVPAFMETFSLLKGPNPVLTPDLSQLSTLSTSQDWTVPLTPSELEFFFYDRVIVDSPDVGQIICETNDEGALLPALVVPAALLGNFSGHTGTVTIYRDDYAVVDAGALVLGVRLGAGIRTADNAVTFTP